MNISRKIVVGLTTATLALSGTTAVAHAQSSDIFGSLSSSSAVAPSIPAEPTDAERLETALEGYYERGGFTIHEPAKRIAQDHARKITNGASNPEAEIFFRPEGTGVVTTFPNYMIEEVIYSYNTTASEVDDHHPLGVAVVEGKNDFYVVQFIYGFFPNY